MNDLLAWFGLKRFPFDKNIKTTQVLQSEPLKEAFARFDYIKRRGGILLLTGDPGVGKTLALRTYYKAANWIRPGATKGRGRYDRKKRCNQPVKAVFVYPLHKQFRRILCHG